MGREAIIQKKLHLLQTRDNKVPTKIENGNHISELETRTSSGQRRRLLCKIEQNFLEEELY